MAKKKKEEKPAAAVDRLDSEAVLDDGITGDTIGSIANEINEGMEAPVVIAGGTHNNSDMHLLRVPCRSYMLTKLLGGGVPSGRIMEVFGDPDAGKCLGKGTPVLMFDGTIKPVENVVPGDVLMGDDNKPRRVLSTTSGVEELFSIGQYNGDDYVVNKSHILSLVKSPTKGNPCKVVDMPLKEYLVLPPYHRFKGYKVPINWPTRKVAVDPYFMGLWIGDGVTRTSGGTPGITINDNDQELLDYIQEFASRGGYIVKKYDKYSERLGRNLKASTYVLCIRAGSSGSPRGKGSGWDCHQLSRDMKSYGVVVQYTGASGQTRWTSNKVVPRDYLINDEETRLQLLAGFLDADGHLNRNGTFDFITRVKLSEFMEFLCRSLGFRVHVSDKIVYGHEYKRFTLSGDLSRIPCKLSRKKSKKRKSTKNPLVGALKVKSIGNGEYYGFKIDGNGRFLLGDFTVTHNTTLVEDMMIGFQRYPGLSVLLDAESKWHRGRAMAMGHNPSRHIHMQVDSVELFSDTVEHVIRKTRERFPADMPVGIFCDTISALETDNEIKGSPFAGGMMEKPRLMRSLCRRLSNSIAKANCSLIFVSQTHIKPMGGYSMKVSSSGGEAVPFWSSIRLKVWSGTGKDFRLQYPAPNSGIISHVKTHKNHINSPWKTIKLPVMYVDGVHPVYELVMFLLDDDKNNDSVYISGGRCHIKNFPEEGKKVSFYMKEIDSIAEKHEGLEDHLKLLVDEAWERLHGY